MKDVDQIITDFKSLDYCCHRIIELNEELEVINHKKLGLSHDSPSLTLEEQRNPLPLPTYQHQYQSPLAIMETIDTIEAELNYYRRRINECKRIELLDMADQNILFDLYIFRINQWKVAEKYGYSRSGLIKHVRNELFKLI
jgi:hypothetical protein